MQKIGLRAERYLVKRGNYTLLRKDAGWQNLIIYIS